MRLDEECRLSFYQQIASLNEDHGVYLVQNISDKKIYVKKILKIYNVEVFRYLNHIAGTISSETPSGEDSIAKLREYKKLLDEGVLSQDEFDALKKKALKI